MSRTAIICLVFVFFIFLPAHADSPPDTIIFDPEIENLINQVSADNIRAHIESLADAGGHNSRVTYTPGGYWGADYIKQQMDSFTGLDSVAYDTFYINTAPSPYDTIALTNVVGFIDGSLQNNQYYMVGGHLDATANLDGSLNWDTEWETARARGADDNASGIAATLEIARILSDPANGFSSQASIRFAAFGAEERHPAYTNNHWGSRFYAQNAFIDGDDILGVYVLDMIGYNNTGNHYFNIVSDINSRPLGTNYLETRDVYSIAIDSNSEPFPSATYSDHDQFWIYRYPAILVIENAPPWENNSPWYNANPFYHRQSDSTSTVNIDQVVKIAQVTLATIASLSNQVTSLPVSNDPPLAAKSFSLLQNYPNPFNATTRLRYQLLYAGNMSLEIYDIEGKRVRTLQKTHLPPGEYHQEWHGDDEYGQTLPSGLYFLSLTYENQRVVRKMILMK